MKATEARSHPKQDEASSKDVEVNWHPTLSQGDANARNGSIKAILLVLTRECGNDPYKASPMVSFKGIPRFIPSFPTYRTSRQLGIPFFLKHGVGCAWFADVKSKRLALDWGQTPKTQDALVGVERKPVVSKGSSYGSGLV